MINFRYHVISIVAVFLALGLGIVMGSTVIDRAIVEGLRNRIDNAEKNSIERKTENDRLQTQVEKQDLQDTALAGHIVKDMLAGQTVYVATIGNVSEQTTVETRELLAVSGASLASEIDFNEDFLKSDKSKIMKDLQSIANVKTLLGSQKNKDSQVAIVLTAYFNVRAGGNSSTELDADKIEEVFNKYDVFSEQEKANNLDPGQPVSFLLLVNRQELNEAKIADFSRRFHGQFPVSIGLAGNDTDKPSRSDAVDTFEDQTRFFSIVDNAESPSGRSTLLLAHAENLTGVHAIYGISSKATSPAPELTDI